MPSNADLVSELIAHLKENEPELYDIFRFPENLEPLPGYKLAIWTGEDYYSEEQKQKLFAIWNKIVKDHGLS